MYYFWLWNYGLFYIHLYDFVFLVIMYYFCNHWASLVAEC